MKHKIRVGSAQQSTHKVRASARPKIHDSARQALKINQSNLAELALWQLELRALFEPLEPGESPGAEAVEQELLDDSVEDTEDFLEPADMSGTETLDPDAAGDLPASVAKQQPVIDFGKTDRLDIFKRDGHWLCRYHEPTMTLAGLDPQDADHVHRRFRFMHALADWLTKFGQAFLAAPSPENWANLQGEGYRDYATRPPIITQDGMLARIRQHSGQDIDESRFSRLLKDNKVWLVWRGLTAAPLAIVFSKDYQLAWAAQGLLRWQGSDVYDWSAAEHARAAIKGRSPEYDSMHDAFTRMAEISTVPNQSLRARMLANLGG